MSKRSEMFKSLLLYSQYILKISLSKDRNVVLHDIARYSEKRALSNLALDPSLDDYRNALHAAIRYLHRAQDAMPDDGIGSYHLANGWSFSYPETTGYIIPTLIAYSRKYKSEKAFSSAVVAADWLLEIQKPSGGWQGGRMNENRPEIVFNTGQVIRGLLAAYDHTGDEKYQKAVIKGCDWLCRVQHPEGFWKSFASMDEHRVYDSYVDAPLLQAYHVTGNTAYKQAAINNLNWIIKKKQQPNGWFHDCDNTRKHNDRPILHTIAYTIDGLLDCGEMLDIEEYIEAAQKPADILLKNFLTNGRLYGRYNKNWKGSEYFICTGGAQMAIAWLKLYRQTVEECYLDAAGRMLDLLIAIQNRRIQENVNSLGALPGSFPVWGRYESFAFPNWATKFFADALLMYIDIINPGN